MTKFVKPPAGCCRAEPDHDDGAVVILHNSRTRLLTLLPLSEEDALTLAEQIQQSVQDLRQRRADAACERAVQGLERALGGDA